MNYCKHLSYIYIYIYIYIFSTKIHFLQQSLLFRFLTQNKATELLRFSLFWNTKSCVLLIFLVPYEIARVLKNQGSLKLRGWWKLKGWRTYSWWSYAEKRFFLYSKIMKRSKRNSKHFHSWVGNINLHADVGKVLFSSWIIQTTLGCRYGEPFVSFSIVWVTPSINRPQYLSDLTIVIIYFIFFVWYY